MVNYSFISHKANTDKRQSFIIVVWLDASGQLAGKLL